MDEAERLCDRLVVMDNGRIVDEGSPAALIERHVTREVVELRLSEAAENEAIVATMASAGHRTESLTDRVLIYADDGDALVAHLLAEGLHPVSVFVRRSTLEDVFLILTGRTLIEY